MVTIKFNYTREDLQILPKVTNGTNNFNNTLYGPLIILITKKYYVRLQRGIIKNNGIPTQEH